MIIPPNNNTIFKSATADPPIEVIFLILSRPLDAKKVTNKIQSAPRIPITCVDLRPMKFQVGVISAPHMALENGIHILDDTETIQIKYEVYHIKVPIKAILGPMEFDIQA